MPQSDAERRKQAYLHHLKSQHQDIAHTVQNGEVKKVTMSNPHLEEDDGRWFLKGEYNGQMVSRFVKPPPKC